MFYSSSLQEAHEVRLSGLKYACSVALFFVLPALLLALPIPPCNNSGCVQSWHQSIAELITLWVFGVPCLLATIWAGLALWQCIAQRQRFRLPARAVRVQVTCQNLCLIAPPAM